MSFRRVSFLAAAALTVASAATAPARAQQYAKTTLTFNDYRSTRTTEPGYQATFGNPLVEGGYQLYDLYTQSSSAGPNAFSSQQISTWGTSPSDLGSRNRPSNLGPNATTIWGNGTTDRLELYSTGNGVTPQAFRLYSMDVASLFAASSITPVLGAPTSLNLYFQYYKTLNSYLTGVPDGDVYAFVRSAPVVNGDAVPLLRTVDFTGAHNTNDVDVTFLSGNVGDLTDASGIYGIQWFQGSLSAYSGINDWSLTQNSGHSHQFTDIVIQDVAPVPEPSTFALAGVGLVTVVGVGLRRRKQTV